MNTNIHIKRQQYLEQIVNQEPSPYVERVIYDYDGSKVEEAISSYASRLVNDLHYLELAPILNPAITKEDIEVMKKRLESHTFKKKHEARLRSEGIKTIRKYLKEYRINATTQQYPLDFGKGLKSDIYVFRGAFKKTYLIKGQRKIEIPTEEHIRFILQHEYAHAEDNFNGIKLEDGLVIDNSNKFKISEEVRDFIEETRAYLKLVEFYRQFGEEHPMYLYSLQSADLIRALEGMYKPKEFNTYERRLIVFQMDKMMEIAPVREKLLEWVL